MEEIILVKCGGFRSTDNKGVVKRAVETNSYDEPHKQLQMKG